MGGLFGGGSKNQAHYSTPEEYRSKARADLARTKPSGATNPVEGKRGAQSRLLMAKGYEPEFNPTALFAPGAQIPSDLTPYEKDKYLRNLMSGGSNKSNYG